MGAGGLIEVGCAYPHMMLRKLWGERVSCIRRKNSCGNGAQGQEQTGPGTEVSLMSVSHGCLTAYNSPNAAYSASQSGRTRQAFVEFNLGKTPSMHRLAKICMYAVKWCDSAILVKPCLQPFFDVASPEPYSRMFRPQTVSGGRFLGHYLFNTSVYVCCIGHVIMFWPVSFSSISEIARHKPISGQGWLYRYTISMSPVKFVLVLSRFLISRSPQRTDLAPFGVHPTWCKLV